MNTKVAIAEIFGEAIQVPIRLRRREAGAQQRVDPAGRANARLHLGPPSAARREAETFVVAAAVAALAAAHHAVSLWRLGAVAAQIGIDVADRVRAVDQREAGAG